MRAAVPAIVFCLHWGTEYSSAENEYQTRIAQSLADAGVDVIYSCGPHVLQPIKTVNSSDGARQTLVLYSAGNFVSDQLFSTANNQGRAEDGLMMYVKFERQTDGSVKLADSSYVLTYCYKNKYASAKTYNTPIPVSAALADPDAFGAGGYQDLLKASLQRSESLMSKNAVTGVPIRAVVWPEDVQTASSALGAESETAVETVQSEVADE